MCKQQSLRKEPKNMILYNWREFMTNTIAIQFKELSYTQSQQPILQHVSGTIESGKITALIGPSGSGKTTLLKMFNQLLSPNRGSISILGKPIEMYPPAELRRLVGIALQDAPIIRGTVFDNLKLPKKLQNQTLTEEQATYYLNLVGLEAYFLNRPAIELSGGQRQRLSIARTLINEPKILLLDEITSALDPAATLEIEQLIQRITKQFQIATVWITHHQKQTLRVSDAIIFLNKGEILVAGGTVDVLKNKNNAISRFLDGGAIDEL